MRFDIGLEAGGDERSILSGETRKKRQSGGGEPAVFIFERVLDKYEYYLMSGVWSHVGMRRR